MAFPLVMPSFLKEFVDVTKPADESSSFADIIVSPAAVEYVLHPRNPEVLRKLMSIEDSIAYSMIQLSDEHAAQFTEKREAILKARPEAEYYWQIRTLMMCVLQNKEVIFEKRILLLNYALKTIQGMIDNHQPQQIPQFVAVFTQNKEYSKVLEYFKGINPNPAFSLSDGISLLKSITKVSPAYKEVLSVIYKNLGVSGPETLNMVDMKKYIELRRIFTEEFMAEHSHWIENLMVNYVWAYSLPYACGDKLNIWENYVFFCALYNAVKVLVTCYMPGKGEEDFVKAVSSFDEALGKTGNDLVWKMVAAIRDVGQANNGDMAILTIS